MKYLILLLITFNLFAAATTTDESASTTPPIIVGPTPEEIAAEAARVAEIQRKQARRVRIKALSSLRKSMDKCGFSYIANDIKFRDKVISDIDSSQLDCLESKDGAVRTERTAKDLREKNKRDAQIRMRARNCMILTGYDRDLCLVNQ